MIWHTIARASPVWHSLAFQVAFQEPDPISTETIKRETLSQGNKKRNINKETMGNDRPEGQLQSSSIHQIEQYNSCWQQFHRSLDSVFTLNLLKKENYFKSNRREVTLYFSSVRP